MEAPQSAYWLSSEPLDTPLSTFSNALLFAEIQKIARINKSNPSTLAYSNGFLRSAFTSQM
jgi:hypothetical protein